MVASFNRTFMELKLILLLVLLLYHFTFNRTFMELKLARNTERTFAKILLIVPLWNWNMVIDIVFLPFFSLLIVPLWNWNGNRLRRMWGYSRTFNRTFMELKLSGRTIFCSPSLSFNRTFMELKHASNYGELQDELHF